MTSFARQSKGEWEERNRFSICWFPLLNVPKKPWLSQAEAWNSEIPT